MWKRVDVQEGHTYQVGLKAHENGLRTFHLLSDGENSDEYDFVTPIVDDHELLKSRRYEEIIDQFGIDGGTEIVIDAHGIWLTGFEADQLEGEVTEIEWYRGIPPAFAPK